MATSRSVPDSVNAADPDVVIVVRTTEGGTGRVANHMSVVGTMRLTTSAPAVSAAARRHSGLRGSGAAGAVLVAATPA